MTAALRSGSDVPVPGLSGAPTGNGGSSPLDPHGRSGRGPRPPGATAAVSPAVRARSAPPRLTVPRYCRVKGCGRRIVRGRLGFLEFVHAERVPFPHYARA